MCSNCLNSKNIKPSFCINSKNVKQCICINPNNMKPCTSVCSLHAKYISTIALQAI